MLRNVKIVLVAAAMFLGTGAALADFTPGPGGSGYPHLADSDGPALGAGYSLIARDNDRPGNGGGYAVETTTTENFGCGGFNLKSR